MIALREVRTFLRRPMYLFTMLCIPVASVLLFTSIMGSGLPTNLPSGLVDADDTQVSRTIVRTLDAMATTNITKRYGTFSEARKAVQRGEIYAFFYIPEGTATEALASRQPCISFYTNEAYFLPGSLLMKEMKLASELMSLSINRQTLSAKGQTEQQAMGIVQPIVLETHPLHNSYLNYSVCLSNMLIPGIILLCILICTAYTIGIEWKEDTKGEWYAMAGESPLVALVGKLLPQALVFILIFIFMDVYLYRYLLYPCLNGLFPMICLSVLSVFAAQGLAVFFFGVFAGMMRFAMSVCSLWGVVSVSLAGFTFPVTAMDSVFQNVCILFPLRHYYLIYVNQALNGFSILYVWTSVVALIVFALLPLTMMWRYKMAFVNQQYIP